MFGHQDNQNDDLSVDPIVAMDDQAKATDGNGEPFTNNDLHPSAAAVASTSTDSSFTPIGPAPSNDISTMPDSPTVSTAEPTQPADDFVKPSRHETSSDLLAIKQQALQQLDPLMDHLDQTPEEKFRTTMMMIQAADNKSLIPSAFQAAQQITDDKSRAQALLDVVNEINYFSQQEKS